MRRGSAPARFAKRALDMSLAVVLLLATLPVLVVALAGSAISLRAWPFFSQTRVGLDGTHFRFLKVRTLPPSTPRYADKYALASAKVPRFTQMLRRLHLDELPQLLLVLTGKMSLVGPRPELPNLHASLDPAFARRRVSVRPGCTGVWQISDRQDHLIGEAPEFDDYYVGHAGLRTDLWVLWRTALQMVPGGQSTRVAYAELPMTRAAETPAPKPHAAEGRLTLAEAS
jgi:lipopolysaccharide/colanic/teichoic acid biosynthesis glycosyltransferase